MNYCDPDISFATRTHSQTEMDPEFTLKTTRNGPGVVISQASPLESNGTEMDAPLTKDSVSVA